VRSPKGLKGGGEARGGGRRGPGRGQPGADRRGPAPAGAGEGGWIWGLHASLAALANPRRDIRRIVATRNAAQRLAPGTQGVDILEPEAIDRLLPPGAVHQGLAVRPGPLDPFDLHEACAPPDGRPVVVLDQVTDPQNVGAIFRSAAAFGARAIVMQDRRAPALTGALAKAAAGAIEIVPHVSVVNIARAVEELNEIGYLTLALEGEAEATLADEIAGPAPVALVLGAEGRGLRDLVSKSCAARARIPMAPLMESLNVSVAAAIALYEAGRKQD
jgi:23S rRNA (guanosine2251-2'-O)-methyltransferase